MAKITITIEDLESEGVDLHVDGIDTKRTHEDIVENGTNAEKATAFAMFLLHELLSTTPDTDKDLQDAQQM